MAGQAVTAWRGRVVIGELRGIPGRCRTCGKPALRGGFGWYHVGLDDEAECGGMLDGERPAYTPDRPPAAMVGAALLAAALISIGAGINLALWAGMSIGAAALVGIGLYMPTGCVIMGAILWARHH